MQRRSFLKAPAFALATLPASAFALNAARETSLQPTADEVTGLPLLRLPPDFTYRALAWTGAPMPGGGPTPGKHDGMGWYRHGDSAFLLRNHELVIGPRIAGGDVPVYDGLAVAPGIVSSLPDGFPGFAGGVTGVALDGAAQGSSIPLLAGTAQNCAGGMTPWGSWLTCEEIVLRGSKLKTDAGDGKDHGYVFEVPTPGTPASAKPIVDMGFMRHEAAVVAGDGNVYLTEDGGPSGFYRMRPYDRAHEVGALDKGGKLQMLRARNPDGSRVTDLTSVGAGATFDADWVPIDNPDQDPEALVASPGSAFEIVGSGRSGPFMQGEAQGGAAFRRLEGCYYSDGVVYFTDTSGGPAGRGSLWAYDLHESTLQLIYASPGIDESNHIDNVTVSDSGLIIACEDGASRPGGGSRMQALAPGRDAVTVAENNIVLGRGNTLGIAAADYRDAEWAGAAFDADGKTLYANIQTPGITFAITGPWDRVMG